MSKIKRYMLFSTTQEMSQLTKAKNVMNNRKQGKLQHAQENEQEDSESFAWLERHVIYQYPDSMQVKKIPELAAKLLKTVPHPLESIIDRPLLFAKIRAHLEKRAKKKLTMSR